MALDPGQATVIEAIGTGICVGLAGYLAYLVFFLFGDSMKAGTERVGLEASREKQ